MSFRRSAPHYGQSPFPETPYQKAGQIWDDRIGAARVQARNWRLMALGLLGLMTATSAALVWRSLHATVTPDTSFYMLCYLPEVMVAGCQLGPGVADPDDRPTVELIVGDALVLHPTAVSKSILVRLTKPL